MTVTTAVTGRSLLAHRRGGPKRRLMTIQFAAAAVDGLVLSTIVIHAVAQLELRPRTVGAVLAGAAVVALVTAPAAGALADRFGLPGTAAGFGSLTALALIGYLTAASVATFAAAAVLFVCAQAAGGSARQALAVSGATDSDRVRIRSTMHTLLNAGLGSGTVLGAAVVATGSQAAFASAYVVGAVVVLLAAGAARHLTSTGGAGARRTPSSGGMLIALRDRRFAAATVLACLVQLTMPILSVLLPVLVLHSEAPRWIAAVALGVNTVLVIAIQSPWTARLVDARTTAGSALVAAIALLVAGALLASVVGTHSPRSAALLVLVAVVALSAGEVSGGAAVWNVALTIVPAHAEGRYQAAFSMSASGARILGPLSALPLVLACGAVGWLVLTSVMATACLLVSALSVRPLTNPSDHREGEACGRATSES